MSSVMDIAVIENISTGEVFESTTALNRLRLLEVAIPGLQGAKGDKGDGTGPVGPSGQPRFVGSGPPGTIIGANPGDRYLDASTGIIYRLD